jgi:hypothetical protein
VATNTAAPISIGFVRRVRDVGGLKSEPGTRARLEPGSGLLLLLLVCSLKTTNITNITNNTEDSSIICVRPLS